MMVKELKPDVLDGRRWVYHQSPAFEIDEQEAGRFDEGLECLEKKSSQVRRDFLFTAILLYNKLNISYTFRFEPYSYIAPRHAAVLPFEYG